MHVQYHIGFIGPTMNYILIVHLFGIVDAIIFSVIFRPN